MSSVYKVLFFLLNYYTSMSIFRIALILFCKLNNRSKEKMKYLFILGFIRFSDSLFCYVCSGCNDPFQVGTNIGVFFADNSGYYCRVNLL